MFGLQDIKLMNAAEAKRLTEKAKTSREEIAHLLKIVNGKIQDAADNKLDKIGDPFDGLRMPYPSPDQIRRVREVLNGKGFTLSRTGLSKIAW